VTQRGYRLNVSLSFEPKIPEKFAGSVLAAAPHVHRGRWLGANRHSRNSAEAVAQLAPSRIKAAASRFLRRAFDAMCSAAGLAILAPLFAMIALAIKLDDGGPIFYSQCRVGRGLRRFRVLKFRTMRCNSGGGCLLTAPEDARVTRVGKFLRSHKLDELPQLANVLRGEMQLVGVRPQVQKFVDFYREEYEELLRTPPGITDVSSLIFRDEARFFYQGSIEEQYVKRILPIKLEMSLKYARTRTFFSDLEILFRTVLDLPCPHTAWEGTKFDPVAQALPSFISKNVS
jgi:lipopolysaccharide/colanic/teichoic acid biosynthesis glycosyltransferase